MLSSNQDFNIGVILLVLVVILIVYLLFEFLLFFAKSKLAYLNSLKEMLKINEVIGDIRNIGIVNIIKWSIVMAILLNVITFVSSFVISIPYVGFLIYAYIVILVIESIANYSLGLLYSNIARNYDDLYFNQSKEALYEINNLNLIICL